MVPEPFNGTNLLVKSPEHWPVDNLGPIYDVPVAHKHGLVLSVWRPSAHELSLLNGGGIVMLTQVTDNPQPTQVEVMPTSVTVNEMARA